MPGCSKKPYPTLVVALQALRAIQESSQKRGRKSPRGAYLCSLCRGKWHLTSIPGLNPRRGLEGGTAHLAEGASQLRCPLSKPLDDTSDDGKAGQRQLDEGVPEGGFRDMCASPRGPCEGLGVTTLPLTAWSVIS